jgi:hypothetical protein
MKISKRRKYNQYYNNLIHTTIPWRLTLKYIKRRCYNKNSKSYKDYGGKGIKCLITEEELKELWFRDKAYLMDKPTIDRKDNNGDYIFENCQYLENRNNILKRHKENPVPTIPILQFDLNGKFIREFISLHDAERKTGYSRPNITNAARGIYKQSNGYIWKFKNE